MVAALSAGVGVIPRVHGSAFFTDGGIQALSVVTLDAERGAHRGECFTADVHTADESFDTGRISSFIRASILPVLPQQEGASPIRSALTSRSSELTAPLPFPR